MLAVPTPTKLKRATAICDTLPHIAVVFKMSFDAVCVRLALRRIVDGVRGIVHEPLQAQIGNAVLADMPLEHVPAGLLLLALGQYQFSIGNLPNQLMGLALGIIVIIVV